jgi:hypothetical protein
MIGSAQCLDREADDLSAFAKGLDADGQDLSGHGMGLNGDGHGGIVDPGEQAANPTDRNAGGVGRFCSKDRSVGWTSESDVHRALRRRWWTALRLSSLPL